MTGRCVITSRHEPKKTPWAAPGILVCRGHLAKVERMISELPGLYDDLGLALIAPDRHGERITGTPQPGLNLNPKAADAREEIRNELVRIVRYVAGTRQLLVWPDDTIPDMACWLLRHTDWLCAQTDADETHDYLEQLHGYAGVANPSGRRRIPLGETCDTPICCDVWTRAVIRCEGRLIAVLLADNDQENLAVLVCDECELEIPAAGWLAFGREREA